MTAKEYLSQAYLLEARINIKMDYIQFHDDFEAKVRTVFSTEIHNVVNDIASMKNKTSAEISRLMALKFEIENIINQVDNTMHRTLLELRYLHYKCWREIAEIMHYEGKYIYKLHNIALKKVDTIGHRQKA
jgi:hypothetical protein